MRRTAWALLAVAAGLLTCLPRPQAARSFRERLGEAVDLGPVARFDGVTARASTRADVVLRRLAREAEVRLSSSRDARSLADAALVQVAAGRPAGAVDLLEEALRRAPADPSIVTDLAAARLLLAGPEPGSARELARALQHADEALARRPSSEALFDRARALDALGLGESARAAWRACLDADRTSAWRPEAEARVGALAKSRRSTSAARRQAVRQAALGASLPDFVRRHAIEARLLVEEDELGAWARATVAGDTEAAEHHLAVARTVARAVVEVEGDRLLADALRAIDAAPASRRRLLVEGQDAYRQGLELAAADAWPAASASFGAARDALRRGGSPLAAAALLQVGVCEYYRPDYDRALAAFRTAGEEGAAYPLLRARSLWLTGLVRFVTGRPFVAWRDQQEARDLFARAGEEGHAAFLDSLLAADLQALGSDAAAWVARGRSLRSLDQVDDARRVFSILWECARVLLDQGQDRAADDVLGEIVERIDLLSDPELRAATLVRRARVAGRLGALERATHDVEEAHRLMAALDPSRTRRLAADLAVTEGEIAAAREPATAVAVFSHALDYLTGSGNDVQTVTLLRLRARALRALAQDAAAERDLRAILDAIERGRAALPDESHRIAYFEQLRDAADELIALQVDTRHPWEALETAERTRARALRERSPVEARSPGLAEVRSWLPSDVAVVEYAALPDRLVVWVVRRGEARVLQRPVPLPRLREAVERCRRRLGADDTAASHAALAELHELLVRPVAPALRGAALVVFVPDKCLHAVPFSALLDGSSGRHLVEDVAVACAPSLALLRPDLWTPPPAPARVLAVVNDAPLGDWPALPAAAEEGRRVLSLYPQGALLEGAAATPAAVSREMGDADVLHVAAHAVGGEQPGLLLRARTSGDDPLFDAGSFPSRAAAGRVRVAVFASCRTAAGAESLEGPLSLARGFLAAGVPAVVASLWDLPDAASVTLVAALHRGLAKGRAPAAALREAQLDALRTPGPAAQPRGWAALEVVVGTSARAAPKSAAVVRLTKQRRKERG